LSEYYLTWAEDSVFDTGVKELVEAVHRLLGEHYQIIELGPGSCETIESLYGSLYEVRRWYLG
jgi:uncharacterized SAM-dependent methyltransferase